MKKSIFSMVIYPAEKRFPRERRYITHLRDVDSVSEITEMCFVGKYEHHYCVTEAGKHPSRNSKCLCGLVKFSESL